MIENDCLSFQVVYLNRFSSHPLQSEKTIFENNIDENAIPQLTGEPKNICFVVISLVRRHTMHNFHCGTYSVLSFGKKRFWKN